MEIILAAVGLALIANAIVLAFIARNMRGLQEDTDKFDSKPLTRAGLPPKGGQAPVKRKLDPEGSRVISPFKKDQERRFESDLNG